MASSRPDDHHLISTAELEYISLRTSSSLLKTSSSSSSSSNSSFSSRTAADTENPLHLLPSPSSPSSTTWLQMLTSRSVRGTIFVAITHTWFYGVLLVKLPAYMLSVLKMDLQEVKTLQNFLKLNLNFFVFNRSATST